MYMRIILLLLCLLLTTQQQVKSDTQKGDIVVKKQAGFQIVYPTNVNLRTSRVVQHRSIQTRAQESIPQPEPRTEKEQVSEQPNQQTSQVTISEGTPEFRPPPSQPQKNKPALVKQPKKTNYEKFVVPLKADFYCGSGNQLPPLPEYDGSRLKPVSTLYGFNMYVDSQDTMVSATIANSGTWEPAYVSLLGHLVKPGNNVLNLGSQSGLEALVMGKIVGPKGKLFIFEPYSFSNKMVTTNIEMNGLSEITTIYKVGASDAVGKAIINVAYVNTGGSQIIPDSGDVASRPKSGQFGKYSQTEQVQLNRVDALIPENVKLDFALLDVQKMETKALLGMKKIIERSPNLVIMTEWQFARNPRANRAQTLELLKFMKQKGYKAYSYNPPWQFCAAGTFMQFGSMDQLFAIQFRDVFFFPSTVPLPK